MIKLLEKDYNLSTFEGVKDGEKIIFQIWYLDEDETLEAVEEILNSAKLSSYISSIKDIKNNYKIPIFEINLYENRLTLDNCSLYNYLKFFKKEKNVPKALKMAFITQDDDFDTFCIECESFDRESVVNEENMELVRNTINKIQGMLEEDLEKPFSHITTYGYY